MIDPVTATGGSAVLGAIVGVVSNLITGWGQNKIELEKIRWENRHEQNKQLQSYQQSFHVGKDGKAVSPPFAMHLYTLTITYCICTAICFACGDIPVASQGFGSEPTKTAVGWGMYVKSESDKTVYLLTFAGLGTYFMAPIAFILTSVFTGIVPKRG